MNCERHTESLIESARNRTGLSPEAKSHLRTCEPCSERWHSELELSVSLKSIGARAAHMRSPASSRAALLHEFDARKVKTMTPRWYWGAAAAAALLFGIALGPEAMSRLHRAQPAGLVTASSVSDAEADPDGFIAVPYAAPLADGEMMRMIHTELNPAALASLGVSVDPAWTTQLPADLLLGEDGMPRAVRVADVESDEGGF